MTRQATVLEAHVALNDRVGFHQLTATQRLVLALMLRSNMDRRAGDYEWVNRRSPALHRGSLDALERMGVVDYDRAFSRVRIRPIYTHLMHECRWGHEYGICHGCGEPLDRPSERGWAGDDQYHYPCARAVYADGFRQTTGLVTVEVSGPGQTYRLLDASKVGLTVHLAGPGKRGGTGPCVCGFDRHARDESGRSMHGFSVGGGITGPDYRHQVCGGCAQLAVKFGAPIQGTHKGLFEAAAAHHA